LYDGKVYGDMFRSLGAASTKPPPHPLWALTLASIITGMRLNLKKYQNKQCSKLTNFHVAFRRAESEFCFRETSRYRFL
jgi:hypothetical protein